MSKLEPRFRAGVLVEENIYFSHARFNGLFKLDINSMRCSFIKEFCGCEIEMKDIHVAGTRYGDWIIFLPAMGNRGKNNVNYWPGTGYYRSSTSASGQRCYYLEFNQSFAVKNNYYWYWDGFPIRCVKR